jgi:aminoglycoside N3'-acetyltransferase
LANHHLARTPCGEGTPFARLLEHDGRILFLGADIESATFFHYVEEVLEPSMPMSPFTTEEFSLQSRDETGAILVSKTRLFDPALSRRRDLHKLASVLRQQGKWAETQLGELGIILLEARDVMAASKSLAAQGVYCYDS